ncbi:hypothetical protein COBT_001763 [Conglomerata obtusa]
MLLELSKRCLYKSITFTNNINIKNNEFVIHPIEQTAITLFNQKNYARLEMLPCKCACNCCPDSLKFLKEYAKLIKYKINKQKIENKQFEYQGKLDGYLLYIQAHYVDKDEAITILIDSLVYNCYFFEAFEYLLFLTDIENFYQVESEIEKNINDYVVKKIYVLLFYVEKFLKSKNLENYVNDLIAYYKIELSETGFRANDKEEENQNNTRYSIKKKHLEKTINQSKYVTCLIAAYYYYQKDYEKSIILFEQNNFECIEFIDLHSNILFIRNDIKSLALLAHRLTVEHPFAPETFISIANYHSLRKERENAIKYFKKSIDLNEKFTSNYTLIGHEYMELGNIPDAIINYNKSINFNQNDHRAIFGMAQALTTLKSYEQAFYFYQKACELQNANAYFWMMFGTCAAGLSKFEDAIFAYQRSIALGEDDSYVKLGDCYKNMKKYEDAVKVYEKYVDNCLKKGFDCKKISNFLAEYYLKIGNEKKSEYYQKLELLKHTKN